MFAYVDESGNTGSNMFDKNQPVFYSAALITKEDFDLKYSSDIKLLARKVDTKALHAAEMGLSKLSSIASHLSELLNSADAKIYLCKVNKIDLTAAKLFDSVFDSGENFAVPWHSYNIRPLRLLLLIKFSYLLDEDLLKRFWNYFLKKNEHAVSSGLAKILSEIKERVHVLPDQRSRDLINEAIDWALENPEAIYAHSAGKIARHSHYPNIIAFHELLRAIDDWSKVWNDSVTTIKHDEQDQFKRALEFWHGILSNASPTPISLIGEPDLVVRRTSGSDFKICRDIESAGLQVIDSIMWLIKKSQDGMQLSNDFSQLGDYLSLNAAWHDVSLEGINFYLEDFFTRLNSKPIAEEQFEKAKELLDFAEKRRQTKMQEYAKEKFESFGKE